MELEPSTQLDKIKGSVCTWRLECTTAETNAMNMATKMKTKIQTIITIRDFLLCLFILDISSNLLPQFVLKLQLLLSWKKKKKKSYHFCLFFHCSFLKIKANPHPKAADNNRRNSGQQTSRSSAKQYYLGKARYVPGQS